MHVSHVFFRGTRMMHKYLEGSFLGEIFLNIVLDLNNNFYAPLNLNRIPSRIKRKREILQEIRITINIDLIFKGQGKVINIS